MHIDKISESRMLYLELSNVNTKATEKKQAALFKLMR